MHTCETLSVLAVIATGGNGVREELIAGCLVMNGLSVTEAAAISDYRRKSQSNSDPSIVTRNNRKEFTYSCVR